ncbi:hypothetical protein [Arthrobacter gandavensis]|uniref:hypothetical protein n=2 Tax=Arthrobacter TaxID=1663 RepID=UPI0031F7D4FF
MLIAGLGGIGMKASRGAWRVVRPVLLGAAAAASWLTLSATAASAEPVTEPDSLLASVSSSATGLLDAAVNTVDQVTDGLLPAPQAPAQAPAPGISLPEAPRLQPALHGVVTAADELVQTVPVVGTLVPAQTLPAATDPILTAVDDITGFAVETIRPTADGLLESLPPVLPPASDAGTGLVCPDGLGDPAASAASGCSETPITPAIPDIGPAAEREADSARFAAPASEPHPEEDAAAPSALDAVASHGESAAVTAASCAEVFPESALPVSSAPDAGTPGGSPQSGLLPLGTGSSVVSPSGAGPLLPGCLSGQHLRIPALAALPASTELMKAPSPVSLDHEGFPD